MGYLNFIRVFFNPVCFLAEPDPTDNFPEIYLTPDLTDSSGPLLMDCDKNVSLNNMSEKTIYMDCAKIIHRKKTLCNRERLKGQRPQWTSLYKPPVRNWTGDLQWRILHEAIATNSFISAFNQSVLNKCPFCDLTENTFHVFTECSRLTSFFSFLTGVFNFFNIAFSGPVFICGVRPNKLEKIKCQLANYLLAEAKLAIYLTRRNKIQAGSTQDPVALWKMGIKAQLNLEFCFHKATGRIEAFKNLWGYKNILCIVTDVGELYI